MTHETLQRPHNPSSHRVPVGALVGAVIVGLAFDLLVWGERPGLGVAVTGVMAVIFLYRSLSPDPRLAASAATFFAAVAWRASPYLQAFNIMFGFAALGLLVADGSDDYDWRLRNVLKAILTPWFEALPRGLTYLGRVTPHTATSRSLLPWLRGALLAVPFLAMFGALFSSADPTFESIVDRIGAIDITTVQRHVLVSVGAAVASLGVWLYPQRSRLWGERSFPKGAAAELSVLLGALNMLFATFVIVQFSHLFGDTDLTLSEAARRGFFELVAVSLLVVVIVLVTDAVAPREASTVTRGSSSLVALTMVIWISALGRMVAYIQFFGLTQLRFYTTAFMLWIGVVLVAIAATVLKQTRFTFTRIAVAAAFALMMTITAVNPDGLIARVNIAGDHPLDIEYLDRLSIDRGAALAHLDPTTCQMVRVGFLEDAHKVINDDFRSWTWSQHRAQELYMSWHDC